MYSVFLKTVDGNEFSKDLSLTLNGKQMDSRTIIVGNNGTTCFADALYSARSEEKVTPKPIEVIEVNGVDFLLKRVMLRGLPEVCRKMLCTVLITKDGTV